MNQLIIALAIVAVGYFGVNTFLTVGSFNKIESNCGYDTGQFDSVCGNIKRVSVTEAYPSIVAKWGYEDTVKKFAGQTQCIISFCTMTRLKKKRMNRHERREWFAQRNPCCTAIGADAYNERHSSYGFARRITQ